MSSTRLPNPVAVLLVMLSAAMASGEESERRWEIQLSSFFRGGTKPVYLYARERGGWMATMAKR